MSSRHRANLVAFGTIVRKEIRRFLRIWVQTLMPPVVTMSLYLAIFGTLIGPRVGRMGGYDYIDYLAPGVIMLAVITNSYSNVVSSFFSAKFQRHVEEMLVSPMPNGLILAGFVTGGVTRGLAVGVMVTLIANVFADLKVTHLPLTLAVVVMTSVLFSLAGFINAIFARNFDDISIIPNFVLTPLTYLGGVFYSIELLSEPWATLSRLNPILYMVNAFRYGILGVSDIHVGVALVIIALVIGLLWTASLWLLARGTGIRA
ncbi:MAG: ABC transporter permease [Planctomycetes bacterium]|nr:ABC transporter permease [Planctomycetota bacterium]